LFAGRRRLLRGHCRSARWLMVSACAFRVQVPFVSSCSCSAASSASSSPGSTVRGSSTTWSSSTRATTGGAARRRARASAPGARERGGRRRALGRRAAAGRRRCVGPARRGIAGAGVVLPGPGGAMELVGRGGDRAPDGDAFGGVAPPVVAQRGLDAGERDLVD